MGQFSESYRYKKHHQYKRNCPQDFCLIGGDCDMMMSGIFDVIKN